MDAFSIEDTQGHPESVARKLSYTIGAKSYEKTVHIKLFSGEQVKNLRDDDGFKTHETIFAGVINSDGSKVFKELQQIWNLKAGLHTALYNAVVFANLGLTENEGKKLLESESMA